MSAARRFRYVAADGGKETNSPHVSFSFFFSLLPMSITFPAWVTATNHLIRERSAENASL